MMKRLIFGFVLGLVVCSNSTVLSDQPNIVLIYLDDFGWKDTGYMGSDFYETPNIDRLARNGLIFTNAYSCAANCAPARACLLSGQYTPRHQIYNVGTNPRGKSAHRRLEHIAGVRTLDRSIKTWAQKLQSAGYRTATMGKWHLSKDPIPYGFDVNIGGTHSGGPPNGYYPPHRNVPNLEDAPSGEYITDRLSEEACKFISANQDQPWMLYLTHFAVHTPLNAKKELVEKYAAKEPGRLHRHVAMATMIQAVDNGVGKIVAKLENLEIRNKTVIMFCSDNGGYGPATDMAPLKGYKGTYYEGGIRVPFFVNWPDKIKPGVSSEPIIGVDLYPTICSLGKAQLPANQPIDGVDLVPLFFRQVENLDDEEVPRSLFWHFPAYLQSYANVYNEQRDPLFRSRPCSVIRKDNWKLIQFFESGDLELYDLKNDIGETENQAGHKPEILQSLIGELEEWQSTTQAAIPTEQNPGFQLSAEQAAIQRALKRQKDARSKR